MIPFIPSYTTTRLPRDIHRSTRLFVPADSSSSSPYILLASYISEVEIRRTYHHRCHSSWFLPLTSLSRGSRLSIIWITTSKAVCRSAVCSSVSVALSKFAVPFLTFVAAASLFRLLAALRSLACSLSHRSSPRGIATLRFSTSQSVSVSWSSICDIRAQGVGDSFLRSSASCIHMFESWRYLFCTSVKGVIGDIIKVPVETAHAYSCGFLPGGGGGCGRIDRIMWSVSHSSSVPPDFSMRVASSSTRCDGVPSGMTMLRSFMTTMSNSSSSNGNGSLCGDIVSKSSPQYRPEYPAVASSFIERNKPTYFRRSC
jgi:hypothetical protein